MDFNWSATVIIAAIVGLVYSLYRDDPATYSQGKAQRISALPGMNHLYRPIMALTLAVSLVSLHAHADILLLVRRPLWVGYLGLMISVGGMTLLVWSRLTLGRQYSPCYDSWAATQLVSSGPYRWIRHPMYSANLLMLIGFTLASGSLWLLIIFATLFVYFVASANFEETALQKSLPGYNGHILATGKFLPRLHRKNRLDVARATGSVVTDKSR
jgi:protein-S-isoprenylcysteine O-methyltransferase Ste14